MMRSFILTITAFIYLSASAGATIHLHYCMGKLVSWGLVDQKGDKCGKCGMEKNNKADNSCCKDEHKKIQLDNDQKIVALSYSSLQPPVVSPLAGIFEFTPLKVQNEIASPIGYSPPFKKILPVYLCCCVFRI
jgi:hypothetical protein